LPEDIAEHPISYLSSHAEKNIAMAKVGLITGSGNGLGRDIAEAALAYRRNRKWYTCGIAALIRARMRI
jgi:hypothetical protein